MADDTMKLEHLDRLARAHTETLNDMAASLLALSEADRAIVETQVEVTAVFRRAIDDIMARLDRLAPKEETR